MGEGGNTDPTPDAKLQESNSFSCDTQCVQSEVGECPPHCTGEVMRTGGNLLRIDPADMKFANGSTCTTMGHTAAHPLPCACVWLLRQYGNSSALTPRHPPIKRQYMYTYFFQVVSHFVSCFRTFANLREALPLLTSNSHCLSTNMRSHFHTGSPTTGHVKKVAEPSSTWLT